MHTPVLTMLLPDRCFGHSHDVWSLFNNASHCCFESISSLCLVCLCFSCHNISLCVGPCLPPCCILAVLEGTDFSYNISNTNINSAWTSLSVLCCRKSIQGVATIYRIYVIVIGIYAGVQFFISFLMRIPACHQLTDRCHRWSLIQFTKWLRQVCTFFVIMWRCYWCRYVWCSSFTLSLLPVCWYHIVFSCLLGTTLCWSWNVWENIWFYKVIPQPLAMFLLLPKWIAAPFSSSMLPCFFRHVLRYCMNIVWLKIIFQFLWCSFLI